MKRKPSHSEIQKELLCLSATKVVFWWLGEDLLCDASNDDNKKQEVIEHGSCMTQQIYAEIKGWA